MLKKLLVLGSVLSALVLTGAGCVGSAPVVPQTNTPDQTQASDQPNNGLPASQPNGSGSTASQPVTTPQPVPPQPTPPPAQSQTHQVSIANFAFSPGSITIKAGDVVKWVNDDQVMHSIKSDSGAFPGSAGLNTGNTYEFKFTTPGTYSYSCGFHPSMHGTIVVQ